MAASAAGEGQESGQAIEVGVEGGVAFAPPPALRQMRLRAGDDEGSAATSEGVAGAVGPAEPEEEEEEEGVGEAAAGAKVGVGGADSVSSLLSRARFFVAALPPRLRRAFCAATKSSNCLSATRFWPALARGARFDAALGTTKEAAAAEGAVGFVVEEKKRLLATEVIGAPFELGQVEWNAQFLW